VPAYGHIRRIVRLLTPLKVRPQLGRWERTLRARSTSDIDALAMHYGSDKSSAGHDYAPQYQQHLGPRRRAVRCVLEIGVGGTSSTAGYETTAGGQSLRMWRDHFPNAQIIGIDIFAKTVEGPRLHFERGDQSDQRFLANLAERYGPFDVIIDDGSHIGRHIIASFEALWDTVRPGGYYVIEDLALAYHRDWEGGAPGTPGTAADLIKRLVDSTLRRHGDPAFVPSIAAMHIYAEIAFFQRA
jgi:hypothetical protein